MPAIAFVMHFFHMDYISVMKLPIRTFFGLHKQGIKMEAAQYRELLRISVTPAMKLEYFNYHLDRYEAIIDPKKLDLPPPAPGPCIDAGSKDAKILVMNVFSNLKRNMGYGR